MANISDTKGFGSLISQYGTDSAKAKAGIEKPATTTEETGALADQNVFLKLYIEQLKGQDLLRLKMRMIWWLKCHSLVLWSV
ncbi:hypothetical protein [Marinomonas sp. GJ51-6]|uniref:hypothetical protein n=1 Tax=Marinomonas sp. GJ51-6 TaxID=2992802 RepID=UPI002934D89F|nr:hypothetical protein [Marinomonas sp. GJ51-6]WOD08213.1 hypothetical protein ONZ50_03430 [Marinomonas sp. GJ51-6]